MCIRDSLCDATSALTVEGDLPSSLAISLHDALRSSILWTVSRSLSLIHI